jgi:ParB family chromosome partitioning protein
MEVRPIPIDLIRVGAHEQRFDYADQAQEDLVASIRANGIMVPLIVQPLEDEFILIDGHRRRQAALQIGLPELPCFIQTSDTAVASRTAFVANFLRKDPTPIELAAAVAKASEMGEDAEREIARALHRSVDWVRRQIAMLQWPEDVLAAIHAGTLSVAAASNLALIPDDNYRAFLLDHATSNGATARTTAAWLQEFQANRPPQVAVTAEPIPGQPAPQPIIPTSPCLCCGIPHRTDELSHVPLCAACITQVRRLGMTPQAQPLRTIP